jgi:hypothetical protein
MSSTVCHDINDEAATQSRVAAYYRDRFAEDESPYEGIFYHRTDDPAVIMAASSEDLLFVDPDATKEEILAAIQSRHPTPHPLLTSIVADRQYNFTPLANVKLRPKQYVYPGLDAHEVLSIAKALDAPVPVTEAWTRKQWDHSTHSQRCVHWDRLHEVGCYLRVDDEGQHFVVYDPKIAARRQKRRSGGVREIPYVTCPELKQWATAMDECNCKVLSRIVEYDRWVQRRYPVMNALRQVLTLFELLHGEGASWQLEEFRALVELWKVKGAATWSEFERTARNSHFQEVFKILDDAAKLKRRPRKRELKPKLPKEFRWRKNLNS